MAANEPVVVYTTASRVNVYVRRGSKSTSKLDFIVSHDVPNDELYQVFHRDFLIDIYRKRQVTPDAFPALVDHLIGIITRVEVVKGFPPALVQFRKSHVNDLTHLGVPNEEGYDLELFLVLFELVQIQEKTNYPRGWLPTELYETLRDNPEDLDRLAYLTEVGVPRREYRKNMRLRDELLAELRRIVAG